jgi:hypothetical protein
VLSVTRLLKVGETTYVLTLEGDLDPAGLDVLRGELEDLRNCHVIVDLLDVLHVGPETTAVLVSACRIGLITIVADQRTTDALHRAAEPAHLRVHAALSDAVAETLV